MEQGDSTKGLESLVVWQKAKEFAVLVCREVLHRFPLEEKWGLTAQLRRAVQSVPANIAEGFGRYYYQEGVRFCYIARGSLEEAYSHLCLARDLGYLPMEDFSPIEQEIDGVRRMLHGYIGFLKRSKRGENDPGSDKFVREPLVEWIDAADQGDESAPVVP